MERRNTRQQLRLVSAQKNPCRSYLEHPPPTGCRLLPSRPRNGTTRISHCGFLPVYHNHLLADTESLVRTPGD